MLFDTTKLDRMRRDFGYLTVEETFEQVKDNVVLDPFSLLIGRGVVIGRGNVFYPNVAITLGEGGAITIAARVGQSDPWCGFRRQLYPRGGRGVSRSQPGRTRRGVEGRGNRARPDAQARRGQPGQRRVRRQGNQAAVVLSPLKRPNAPDGRAGDPPYSAATMR